MKQEITWKDLIKRISSEQKKKGSFNGLKGILGEAKKEWDIIKSGNHEIFSVGQGQKTNGKTVKKTRHNKNKNKDKNKSRKNKMKLCDTCKLCEKCIKRNGM